MRNDGRQLNELRPVSFVRNYTKHAEGSVLVSFGNTKVLCTASVEAGRAALAKRSGSGLAHG